MHALLITALIGTQVTQIGSFLVGQRSDPITDVVQSLALLTDGDQSLAVGCNRENEGRISLFFRTNAYLRTSPPALLSPMMTVRFDRQKPMVQLWDFDRHGAETDARRSVAEFVKGAVEASHVAVRVQADDGSNVDVGFDTIGARDAIKTIAQKCGDDAVMKILQ